MKKISLLFIPMVIAASSFVTSCAEKCKVTFETNGGTEIKAVEVSKGSYLNRPVNPTRDGYIMSGWYKDPELEYKFSFRDDEVPEMVKEDMVLYAKWTDVSFNINYVIKNGTNSPDNPDSYLIKEDVSIAPAVPNRGYEFGGWYDNQQFSGDPITGWAKYTHYSQVTLYAKIDPIVYSITYENLSGAEDPGNPKTYTIEDNVVLKDAVLAGRTFTGWYIGQMEIPGWKPGKRIGDVTLTARWDLDKYSITYDFAGGTDPENQISYTIEDDVVLKPSTRRGYDFTGWVDEDGKTVTGWLHGEKTGDIKLTATWKAINYDITYDFAGGADPGNPKTYTIEDSVTLKPSTRTGYNFTGWIDEKGNIVTGWAAGEKTGSIKLTATWEAVIYTITYNLEGGENDPDNPTQYTIEDNVTLKPATREGFAFAGWSDGKNIIDGWKAGEKINAVNLTAKWGYSINYHLNEGTNNPNNPLFYTTDVAVTLKPATRDGYSFGGWYLEEDFSGIPITGWEASEKTGIIDLYAKWNDKEGNSLTFDATSALKFTYQGVDITEGTTIPYSSDGYEIKIELSDKIPAEYKSHFSLPKEVRVTTSDDEEYLGSHSYDAKTGTVKLDMYTSAIISASPTYDSKTIEELSWSEINTISTNGIAEYTFKVGDTKEVALYENGLVQSFTHTVRIIGFNHDDKTNGGKAGITFEFADTLTLSNKNCITTPWGGGDTRYEANRNFIKSIFNTLLTGEIYNNVIPSDLRNEMKEVTKYVGICTASTDFAATSYKTKIFPLAHDEIVNNGSQVTPGEGTKYQYYSEKTSNKYRVKTNAIDGNASGYWLRSPAEKETFFSSTSWSVDGNGNIGKHVADKNADFPLSIAPAFCI